MPKQSVHLARLIEAMDTNRTRLHVRDWGLSHTSLEEVFLRIVADVAAASSAAAALAGTHAAKLKTGLLSNSGAAPKPIDVSVAVA